RRQDPLFAHPERLGPRHAARAGGPARASLHRPGHAPHSRGAAPLARRAGRNPGRRDGVNTFAPLESRTAEAPGAAMPLPVLWLDGEADFLRAHTRFLEKRGFAVERVSTLSAALELL